MRRSPSSSRLLSTAAAVIAVTTFAACGGGGGPPAAAPEGEAPPPVATARPELKGAEVYDEAGQAHVCESPPAKCPEIAPASEFLDRCRLGGYQVRQCGCAL